MKKLILVLTIVIVSFAFLNAGSGKYADIKDMLSKQFKVMEACIETSETVKDAKDASALINKMKDGFKELIPDIKAVVEKYGNLEELFENNTPEELKPDMEKLKKLTQAMFGAFMKLAQYAQDPEVKKAQAELGKVMAEMKQIVQPKPEKSEVPKE